jgi:hypothetical protein
LYAAITTENRGTAFSTMTRAYSILFARKLSPCSAH